MGICVTMGLPNQGGILKTHFEYDGKSACSRGSRTTINTYRVDCGLCKNNKFYVEASINDQIARDEAYEAQVPRTVVPQFGRVNDDGVMECPKCQGVLWKEKPRNLWSYHYVCQGCQFSVHPMTETGMCQ